MDPQVATEFDCPEPPSLGWLTERADLYTDAWYAEAQKPYPMVDRLEDELSYSAGSMLEVLALILATPLKKNPPNWQHGRVIYATLCDYIKRQEDRDGLFCVDIGTAKGFSAAAMGLAMQRMNSLGGILSIDKLDPWAPCERNTIMETMGGPRPLMEWLPHWLPKGPYYEFLGGDSLEVLEAQLPTMPARVNFAFVDGGHNYQHVYGEGSLLSQKQHPGDITIFDDVQIRGVAQAVNDLRDWYNIEIFQVLPTRAYAIARRKPWQR